ncbi:probable LRR receptor-like serine/threonine-protein kinase At4g29180 [Malus sylvestris]|uniref:probable LRR receptor-like serine/threonine-protein kinase At4g29180 n=1 Tax=Malus sylvestris TaxID=3752 RepID=UPI0021ACDA52|nr:probable LRR receptor-like serine/threonine-protein kinase At4g29180 [Malus sylvestris]
MVADADRSSHVTWEMRHRIALDIALGLHYLHKGCNPRIVHRDVKIANILLSENLDAKIADFGLSMVFPSDNETHVVALVMGTVGYLLIPSIFRFRVLRILIITLPDWFEKMSIGAFWEELDSFPAFQPSSSITTQKIRLVGVA